jgi:hypothetical protein
VREHIRGVGLGRRDFVEKRRPKGLAWFDLLTTLGDVKKNGLTAFLVCETCQTLGRYSGSSQHGGTHSEAVLREWPVEGKKGNGQILVGELLYGGISDGGWIGAGFLSEAVGFSRLAVIAKSTSHRQSLEVFRSRQP